MLKDLDYKWGMYIGKEDAAWKKESSQKGMWGGPVSIWETLGSNVEGKTFLRGV